MKKTFIVTAGGIGKRMGSEIPKQFIEIQGKPILMHTLENLYSFSPDAQFILTLPVEWFSYWNDLIKKHKFQITIDLIEGGKERFDSIQNALKLVTGDIVAIHDGVRPFVSHTTLQNLFEKVSSHKAVIPIVSINESLREIVGDYSEHIQREKYKIVQTPQIFQTEIIKSAYTQPFSDEFTDDASVVEKSGTRIELVQGNYENIKITSPEDLKLAHFYLSHNIN
jgi:2-C-methyl-D-erythritol 4-phosphate cytidylyltransferase